MEEISTKSGRFFELDLLKSFTIIICMIPVHVWLAHTDGFNTPFTFAVDSVFGGLLAAPVFMFCMGMGFVFTRHNSPAEMSWRGVKLLTYGAALSILVTIVPYLLYSLTPIENIYTSALPSFANAEETLVQSLPTILTVDIMQLAGLSFLLYSLFRMMKLGPWPIFLISIAMGILGTTCTQIDFHVENPLLNHILGLFVMTYDASCFPLCTWFVFIAGGNLFGSWYKNIQDKGKVFRWLVPAGLALIATYMLLAECSEIFWFEMFDDEKSFYGMIALDAVRVVVIIPTLIGLWWFVSRIVPEKWMGVISYPSGHINQFYMVSWVLICLLMGLMRSLNCVTNTWTLMLDVFFVVALTSLAVVTYNKYLKTRCEAAISSHKYLWMAAVWCIWLGTIVICNI